MKIYRWKQVKTISNTTSVEKPVPISSPASFPTPILESTSSLFTSAHPVWLMAVSHKTVDSLGENYWLFPLCIISVSLVIVLVDWATWLKWWLNDALYRKALRGTWMLLWLKRELHCTHKSPFFMSEICRRTESCLCWLCFPLADSHQPVFSSVTHMHVYLPA